MSKYKKVTITTASSGCSIHILTIEHYSYLSSATQDLYGLNGGRHGAK